MSLLINSNKTGFEQLLSDRSKIAKRLKTLENETEELKKILLEFDESIKLMKSLFYPSVRIAVDPDNPKLYVGYIFIKFPKPKRYKFEIGEVNNYKNRRDSELIKRSKEVYEKLLMTEFPEYFF